MADLIKELLQFAWMFGLAILILLVVGFMLFDVLKKAGEERDKKEAESKSD